MLQLTPHSTGSWRPGRKLRDVLEDALSELLRCRWFVERDEVGDRWFRPDSL